MQKTITMNGVVMDYATFGQGERALVILPGIGLKSVLPAAPAVEAQFHRLAACRTVYLFDRRRDLPEDYTVFDMADDTVQAIRALHLEKIDIYGASQGGMMGQLIAARHPELVVRLLAASSLCRQTAVSRESFERWLHMSAEGRRGELICDMLGCIYSPAYLEKFRAAFDAMPASGSDEDYRRLDILLRACLSFDGWEETGRVRCPVLAVGSAQDRVLGAEASREVAERCGGECYLYEGYSHAVYDEAPDFPDLAWRFFTEDGKA